MNIQTPTRLPAGVKTAFDLLTHVRRLILDEPRRYDQGLYIVSEKLKNLQYQIDSERNSGNPKYAAPACGTVGCVAGWVSLLGVRAEFPQLADQIATKVLGLNPYQSTKLFDGGALHQYLKLGQNLPNTGTRAYARLGAKHIAVFIAANEPQLKDTMLADTIPVAEAYLTSRLEEWRSYTGGAPVAKFGVRYDE